MIITAVEEMDAGIEQFYLITDFPRASVVVNSGGGGKHLYWESDQLIYPDEWQPLADALVRAADAAGLKIDSGVTVNPCCLLRIPDTFNWKTNPPKPVTLDGSGSGERYSFEDLQQALALFATPQASSRQDTSMSFKQQLRDKSLIAGSKIFTSDDYDDLGAGIETRKMGTAQHRSGGACLPAHCNRSSNRRRRLQRTALVYASYGRPLLREPERRLCIVFLASIITSAIAIHRRKPRRN